jgi:hypothetical protein
LTIKLNHTIVYSRDKHASSAFLAGLLGLRAPVAFGPFWADLGHGLEGEINTHDGGRGVYFDDPSGHSLEILTRPYADAR